MDFKIVDKSAMCPYYANQPITNINEAYDHSIFLAGPTPRSDDVASWRPTALELLRDLNYRGFVWIPERTDGDYRDHYINQVKWEKWGLENAKTILFWVPRDLERGMPAFTTNVEFGRYVDSGRAVYGRPNWAEKCNYLDWMYKDVTGKDPNRSLQETLEEAIGDQ